MIHQRKNSNIELFQLNLQPFDIACFCVFQRKHWLPLGWTKQCSWRQYFFFNFFAILRLQNLLNWDMKYTTHLKDIFIMLDVCVACFWNLGFCWVYWSLFQSRQFWEYLWAARFVVAKWFIWWVLTTYPLFK